MSHEPGQQRVVGVRQAGQQRGHGGVALRVRHGRGRLHLRVQLLRQHRLRQLAVGLQVQEVRDAFFIIFKYFFLQFRVLAIRIHIFIHIIIVFESIQYIIHTRASRIKTLRYH